MKNYCFTVDDNIKCLQEISCGEYASIFEHPYLSMYKRLHDRYGLKVQLNLFYEKGSFDLSKMSDRFKNEWRENSDWLKMSFHSRLENIEPYRNSGYDEVFADCQAVNREIVRFAGEDSLAKTTTIHYCYATEEGLCALKDNSVRGLLGLFDGGRVSYVRTPEQCDILCRGDVVDDDGISYAMIDVVINNFSREDVLLKLDALKDRSFVRVMIHEQYFYSDYPRYQPDFEEKIGAAFDFFEKNGFESIFFEEVI